jgi:23S rRNA G2445 N2-methylase RlmL
MSTASKPHQHHFFMTCPRGLETALQEELHALQLTTTQTTDGGVSWIGTIMDMMRANLYSRIGSRLLWRLAYGTYQDAKDIYRLGKQTTWSQYFDVHHTFRVHAEGRKHTLKSLDFAALTLKDAICDQFRSVHQQRPSVATEHPDMRIHLFVDATHASLYLDTSGEALFKRGWRTEHFSAPLRENLAAGILHLCRWTPEQALYDFMCGSGTFLIEAAQKAYNIPPGLRRSFAFEKIKSLPLDEWEQVQQTAQKNIQCTVPLQLFGNDTDPQAIELSRRYLEKLNLAEVVHLSQKDCLLTKAPAASGLLLANPPYGVRLEDLEYLAAWYPQLGNWLKKNFSDWTAYILSSDLRLPSFIGLTPKNKTPLFNGALECRLFRFPLVKGIHRPRSISSGMEHPSSPQQKTSS